MFSRNISYISIFDFHTIFRYLLINCLKTFNENFEWPSLLTRRVQGKARWAFASIRTVGINASTAFADSGVELALVDVRATFAVHFCVALRALAEGVIADFARTAPSHADRTAALRTQGQSWQIVLAAAVYYFGPAGASSIV